MVKIQYTEEESKHLFFTSDTHFNHKNIIKYTDRPFSSIEEHNQTLIDNWNSVVGPDDTVFHLGDFAFGTFNQWKMIREQLNGYIVLILGNHDFAQCDNISRLNDLFDFVSQQMLIRVGKKRIILSHYPMLCYSGYNSEKHPTWQLFGHVHLRKSGVYEGDMCRLEMCYRTQYEVGVDLNNFTPVSFESVRERINIQQSTQTNVLRWVK